MLALKLQKKTMTWTRNTIMIMQITTLITERVTTQMTWAELEVIQLEVVRGALSWTFSVTDSFFLTGFDYD
jgi:hypothetical protein